MSDLSPRTPLAAGTASAALSLAAVTPTRSSKKPFVADHVRTIGAELRNLDEPVRRLIISKVVLRNFKSYGGTTVIGPFHKRFTSIVGPNGSGKSNVIDAMLFVFGFRAKQMRFEKLSELIHSSNAYIKLNNGKPLDSMEVAIHFCEILDRNPDIDDFEVIPGSELVISREVNRDNSSKYRINGSPASQKQVSNSLKSFGMDLYNNRFLILQGEVEQISQMKPKATKPEEEGLLEYLEDIIGTNQYLEKIKEAQVGCEALQDQYRERGNRARLFQKEVEDLLEPKREADAYISQEKSLLHTKILVSQKEISSAMEGSLEMTRKLEELQEKSIESSAYIDIVNKERDQASGDLKQAESSLEAALKAQKIIAEKMEKLVTRDDDLRKQLLREVKKVEEKTLGIKKATANQPKYEAEHKQKLAKSEELLKQIPAIQEELDKAEKELEVATEKMRPELNAANQALAKDEAKLAPLQQAYDQVNKDIKVLKSSIDMLQNNRNEAHKTLASMKDAHAKLGESVKKNKSELQKKEHEVHKLKIELEANDKKAKDLDAEVKSRSQVFLKRKGEYDSMKREFNEMAGSKDQYRYIMGMAASGKIRGIHGRLGDLGSISPKYEKAFMAAAGGQVDVLIVDTPDVASQIFDELRRQNLGRSSAMALSVLNNDLRHQMEKFERTPLEGMPEGVQYLVELTQPSKPIYKICFYYALRDTLLAKDLNDATHVGYKYRRRVVTLEGELIEPDGRMSGGGVQSRKGGGIKTKESDAGAAVMMDGKQLEALGKEIEKESELIDAMKRELVQINQRQTLTSKEMGDLQYSIEMLRQTAVNEEVQFNELSQSIQKAVSELQLNDEHRNLEMFKKQLEDKKKELSVVAAKVQAQEKVVEEAYKAVDSVGNGSLKRAKERVHEIELSLSNIREDVEKLRKEAANMQANAQKCGRDIAKLTKEIEQHKSREKEVELQLNRLEEEAAVATNQMNEANVNCLELKKKVKELNVSLTEKNKVINDHELKFVDMKHQMDELAKQLKAAEQRAEVHRASLKEATSLYRQTCAMIRSSNESQELLNSCLEAKTQLLVILDEDDQDAEGVCADQQEESCAHIQHEVTMLSEEELKKLDIRTLRSQLEEISKGMVNVPNLAVLDQFKAKVQEYSKRKQELTSVQIELDNAKRHYEQLCIKRKTEFLSNFAIIATKLKEIYQTITLGGDAELELVDSTDPFTEGILFSVRPAKKSWKQIQNLSGGEKTLSSLALVFALHHYKPNPVYFMDEIDAALDFRNVSIIAQSIKERTKDAQFIIISLRNQMFELCNQMVGIYKTLDVTKSVCINPSAFAVQKRKQPDEEEAKIRENLIL